MLLHGSFWDDKQESSSELDELFDGGGDGGMITEEFDVVDFEVYCLSDD